MSSSMKDARWQLATDYAKESGAVFEDYDYEGWQALLARAQWWLDSLPDEEVQKLANRWGGNSMTDNKLSATYHPHTTPTPDDPSPLDLMERDGYDDTDVHGYHKGFVVTLVLLVVFWVSLVGYIVWAVTR